jgi:hypothetical protein
MNNNMQELEKNTQEKKLFDPIKAKAQVQVYKEIYNLDDSKNSESGDRLRILQSASDDDLKNIKTFFEKQNMDSEDSKKR